MLRSQLPRAVPSASALRCSLHKSSPISRNRLLEPQRQQARFASAQHAISNPTLAGIEKRWEQMPPQEQAELWMQLRDRMKVDWHELTMQEKKAGMFVHTRFSHKYRSQDRRPIRVPLVCPKHPFLMALKICPLSIITDLTSQLAYWVSFGPHGPRAFAPPGSTQRIIKHVTACLLISFALFAISRYFARPAPHTMTQEYQEMTNEYLRVSFVVT